MFSLEAKEGGKFFSGLFLLTSHKILYVQEAVVLEMSVLTLIDKSLIQLSSSCFLNSFLKCKAGIFWMYLHVGTSPSLLVSQLNFCSEWVEKVSVNQAHSWALLILFCISRCSWLSLWRDFTALCKKFSLCKRRVPFWVIKQNHLCAVGRVTWRFQWLIQALLESHGSLQRVLKWDWDAWWGGLWCKASIGTVLQSSYKTLLF